MSRPGRRILARFDSRVKLSVWRGDPANFHCQLASRFPHCGWARPFVPARRLHLLALRVFGRSFHPLLGDPRELGRSDHEGQDLVLRSRAKAGPGAGVTDPRRLGVAAGF